LSSSENAALRPTMALAVAMAFAVLIICPLLGEARAQQAPDPVGLVRPTAATWEEGGAGPTVRDTTAAAVSPAPWWAPVASGVVPGTGQFALRQQRSVAYAVAEAFLILQYVAARRDGNRDRSTYRDLAANVARKPFGANAAVGPWEYYEAMEKFLESGAYDRIPGGAIDPETDLTTYNGARWLLARETYWRNPTVAPSTSSPEYQRALAFYQERAVRDGFRWSWRDAQLQQDLYRQTIAASNRSYQRAVTMTGLIALNHLASLIDGYVSVRVRRYGGVAASRVQRVTSNVALVGDPARRHLVWQTHLQLALRR